MGLRTLILSGLVTISIAGPTTVLTLAHACDACNFILDWGTKPNWADPSGLIHPLSVAADQLGNVYVTDNAGNRVLRFTSSGEFLTAWGCSNAATSTACPAGSDPGQFDDPHDVAVDSSGSIYITDFVTDHVQKLDSSGKYLLQWGSNGKGKGQFDGTYGITVDRLGYVYVVDGNGRIEKFGDQYSSQTTTQIATVSTTSSNAQTLQSVSRVATLATGPAVISSQSDMSIPLGVALGLLVSIPIVILRFRRLRR